jgi:hypothetical protein
VVMVLVVMRPCFATWFTGLIGNFRAAVTEEVSVDGG